MSFRVLGTGMYVPPRVVTNDDLSQFLETNDEWITQRVGVKERHISTNETAADMGAKAARAALENSGVAAEEIDLIVRGICCLVPNRPFSANIKVTRIVDMFLEHSRIWYFYNDGEEELFLTSADWMRRNLNRRIETAFPILNAEIKRNIIDILNIQLQDNVKACLIDEHLHNNFKRDGNPVKVRAQLAVYEYLKNKI